MNCVVTGARSAFKGGYSNYPKKKTILQQYIIKKQILIPSSSSLTYEGLFSENFFSIQSKEDTLTNNIELSTTTLQNPLNPSKTEQWIGLLFKSKYDGEGIREPIDLSIAVDISGSMNSTIWNKKNSKKSRLDLAKEALFTLITKLKENDHIGITSFNTNSQVIQSMISAKDLVNNEQFTNSILSMKAKFGTNLYEGLKGASSLFSNEKFHSNNKNKRIIFYY